jgi:flagellar hook assembly protein FlgD
MSYVVRVPGYVTVTIHDLAGRIVAVPFSGHAEAGDQHIVWDGRAANGESVSPGVYVVNIEGKRAGTVAQMSGRIVGVR